MTDPVPFLPFKSDAKDAPAYWLLDVLWIVHATGEQTGGRYSVIEQYMPEGSGPPPHVHPFEDEAFYVLAGEMTVNVGGESLILGAGSIGNVPRNTVHSFKVTSQEVCHLLNFYTPAGFEQAITGCSRPAESRTLPPKGLDAFDSPQVVRFYNNYWIAPAELPWALQKAGLDRRV